MSRLYTLFALPFVASLAAAQTPCDQLKLSFPDARIMSIEFVPAGRGVFGPNFFPETEQGAGAGMHDLGIGLACFRIVVN